MPRTRIQELEAELAGVYLSQLKDEMEEFRDELEEYADAALKAVKKHTGWTKDGWLHFEYVPITFANGVYLYAVYLGLVDRSLTQTIEGPVHYIISVDQQKDEGGPEGHIITELTELKWKVLHERLGDLFRQRSLAEICDGEVDTEE